MQQPPEPFHRNPYSLVIELFRFGSIFLRESLLFFMNNAKIRIFFMAACT